MLTDIGVEELGHLEIIGTIVHQLTRSMTPEEIKKAGYEAYFVDHTAGVYPAAASGFPWNAASMAVKGDLIADLTEDLAAEQKARVTYDNIRKSSKMVACGCLTLKSMVMGTHPLTASFLRFPQCGHPSSERSCHSVRQSKGRA